MNGPLNGIIGTLLLWVVPSVIAITLHEAAHGYAALAMGDDTAQRAGRLSLNPLVHVDRVGTLLLPGFLLISQMLTIGHVAFVFGWAKPVPVGAWRFRHPRQGMMVVAAAGPAMNFGLGWLGALAFYAVPLLAPPGQDFLTLLLLRFMIANLALGLFNLLPIPPLDGGRIMVGLLPEAAARAWAGLERVGLLLVMALLWVVPEIARALGTSFNPIGTALLHVMLPALRLLIALAGNPAAGVAMLDG